MRYIAYLLAKPNEDTSAAALRNRFGAGASAAVVVTMGAHQAESEGLAESRADRYDLIDDTTRRQLEARLAEIELDRIQARERHDRRAVRALSDEAMRLSQYLKEASGLAGQTRHFGSEEERVAEAVRTAIRRARERIREHHLELANHLKVTIRGGLHISYTPGSPMLWDAEP